ncbi:MAG TPA: glycerol-3-phosphate 1-O-acyltransferase PlsY [Phenylobacterium sp.]
MFGMLSAVQIATALIGGYLLGSIPFGVIATRMAGVGDVRSIGSGSIGATNVLRTGRRDLALITVLGDGGKGALAVALAWWATQEADRVTQAELMALAGGAAFIGHLFSVWLGFKGGKGVATFFGTLLAAAWPAGVLAGATWLLVAFVSRISSVAGLAAALTAPLYVYLTGRPPALVAMTVVMGVLIFVRHAANIRRLAKGQEPKIGAGKAPG